jgi:hypothetical protein
MAAVDVIIVVTLAGAAVLTIVILFRNPRR